MREREHGLLERLKHRKGFYECPVGPNGKLLGPLVGYTGTYDAPDGTKKHYVGKIYYNLAMAEEWSGLLELFAEAVASDVNGLQPDACVGMPMGGLLLAQRIAAILGTRLSYAEKLVTVAATDGQRETSKLVFARHGIESGEKVLIVEDICNNFSTTMQGIQLIEDNGGKPIGIVCAVNRSEQTEWNGLPVISSVFKPTPQFKQEDPEVAEYIARDQVIWKPKPNWDKLAAAMAVHPAT